ncbi:MAG: desulfoferrodoxin [Nanoarchaeota archaeon]
MATKLNEIYKCEVCGNIVKILNTGEGELVCCNQPMQIQEENTINTSKEKHVPFIKIQDDIIYIQIGETMHPMEEKHYIEWIEVITDNDITLKKQLNPNQKPKAEFIIPINSQILQVRAYCNIHKLWSKTLDNIEN